MEIRKKNHAFGNIDAQVQSNPRIFSLNHNKDKRYNVEWKWKTFELYESLDRKLPNLLSWSACLVDHSVILFGGRQEDKFSNEVFKVQLHPEYVVSLRSIQSMARLLNQAVGKASKQYYQEKAKEEIVNLARSELEFIDSPSTSAEKVNVQKELSTIRVFSLNIHGWSNVDRSLIIDGDIADMIELHAPDVVCLQEVKHPFPSNKGNHVVRVNGNDKAALLRYSDDESSSEILTRLTLPTITDDLTQFLEDPLARNKVGYLDKVFKNAKCEKNKNVLDEISKSSNMKFEFTSAMDATFGNAILIKNKENSYHESIKMDFEKTTERRSASMIRIVHSRNWDFAIVNIHLDEKQEHKRIQQFFQVIQWLKSTSNVLSLPHILCGDFNALSFWLPATAVKRSERGFEAPSDKLYKILTEEYNYFDLELSEPRNTCRHGTRVDYILCSEGLYPRLHDHKLYVLPSKSDHSALLALLTLNLKKVVIGITGLSCTGLNKAASELKKSLVHQKVEIMDMNDYRNHSYKMDPSSFATKKIFSDICKSLSENDILIVIGQHLHYLFPSIDLLFILEFSESKSFR